MTSAYLPADQYTLDSVHVEDGDFYRPIVRWHHTASGTTEEEPLSLMYFDTPGEAVNAARDYAERCTRHFYRSVLVACPWSTSNALVGLDGT